MARSHTFEGRLLWTGQAHTQDNPLQLPRDYLIEFEGKAPLAGSAPAVFKGDDSKHNPESLMVSSIMACHHLTYLALCEREGVHVDGYEDHAIGTLARQNGLMRMIQIVLRPKVRVRDAAQIAQAHQLHDAAHAQCFMSNSVNFEILIQPEVSA